MRTPAALGFAAHSGTGKTELLTQLIPLLTARGLRVGAIKHAHHSFDVDQPGKDSHRLRTAGACTVLISSARRQVLIHERTEEETEPGLDALLGQLGDQGLDLVLVEGYKRAPLPKIELHRPSLGHPLLYPDDPNIVAVARDAPLAADCALPQLDLNDPAAIADFISRHLGLGESD